MSRTHRWFLLALLAPLAWGCHTTTQGQSLNPQARPELKQLTHLDTVIEHLGVPHQVWDEGPLTVYSYGASRGEGIWLGFEANGVSVKAANMHTCNDTLLVYFDKSENIVKLTPLLGTSQLKRRWWPF